MLLSTRQLLPRIQAEQEGAKPGPRLSRFELGVPREPNTP